jgi:predicted DNA-binding antitoxin AbrB/MazE fold protein
MTLTIEAVYENGVLKPDRPLPFQDRARVRLTVETAEHAAARFGDLLDLARDLPDAPVDLSSQHDHYLYGTPKR